MQVRIDKDKTLLEYLEESGNTHTDLDGSTTYVYSPKVFMIRGGELYELENSEVPDHVRITFIKSVP